MKMIKFLHCADLHLDAPFTTLGADSGKASERRLDLKQTFEKIIDVAREEEVDLILISGDLYEHSYVRKSTIVHINDKFSEIPDIQIFIIPGNHDPYIANSFYRNYSWSNNVHILCEDNPKVVLDDLQTCVYGVGFKNFLQEAAQIKDIKLTHPDFINILLFHGTVDMDFNQLNSMYNPAGSKELSSLGMDYIALGHFHGRGDDIGNHRVIYNPGSPEPLGFDETGEHGIYIGRIRKENNGRGSLDIRFARIGRKQYTDIGVNINGCSTEEQVISRINAAIDNSLYGYDRANGLYCITLKGYTEFGFKVDTRQILSYFNDKVFFIKIKDAATSDFNFDEIRREPGLRGLFARKIFERIEKTQDEHQKELLMKSLYYGIETLDSGKVEIS